MTKQRKRLKTPTLRAGAELLARELTDMNRNITARHYITAAERWVSDMGDMPLDRLSGEDMERWKMKLQNATTSTGARLSPNTVDYYFRTLRTVFNKAITRYGITDHRHPFERIHTKAEPTVHRALSFDTLMTLQRLKLGRIHAEARDVFMLSVGLRGIAPVDLWGLKKRDMAHGRITYRRSKTRTRLEIRIEPDVARLINRYRGNGDLLLSLPTRDAVNWRLKVIGRTMGLPFPLTLYVARHTWATMAQRADAPLSVISKAMGHSNLKTTQIYLAGIETGVVDDWNANILNLITKHKPKR